MNIFKVITAITLVVFSNICFSADMNTYDGIWQDIENSNNYYSIHEKDNKVVLINLSGIESTGNTLKSAYTGNTADFVLAGVLPGSLPLKLQFQSSSEGLIYPICDVCSVVATKIRKIF